MIVADSCAQEREQLNPFLDILTSVLKEQVPHTKQFNLIRCTEGVQKWKDGIVDSTSGNISDAVCWIQQSQPQETPFKTNIVEGLIAALAHSDAQAIYIFANREDTLRAFAGIQEKVSN